MEYFWARVRNLGHLFGHDGTLFLEVDTNIRRQKSRSCYDTVGGGCLQQGPASTYGTASKILFIIPS